MADFKPVITFNQTSFILGDMLERAARMAGVLKHPGMGGGSGQGLAPEEQQEFLQICNSMVDGWKIESLMIEYTRRTIQPFTLNQQDYGVGPGQDWDIERPEKIHRAGFIVTGAQSTPPYQSYAEIPMRIILNYEDWASEVVKHVESSYPLMLYYKPAVPIGQATLWPVPNANGTLAIYTPQLLSEFLTLNDPVYVRDGVREMLQYNLAIRIHEVYPANVWDGPSVTRRAEQTMQRVKSNQLTPIFIGSDPAAMQERYTGTNGWVGGTPRAWTPY